MNRISRTASAVVLSVALLIATVSVAQARPLQTQQAVKPAASWLDAAVAWLSELIVGSSQAPSGNTGNIEMKILTSGSIGTAVPMTGVCIDPNGNTVPCGTGGAGGV
jgi:hypothetical protein